MRVVICAMAKNEHLYINEWVRHYVRLGVDMIYLYDNDDPNSKPIKQCIDKELRDKVFIYDIRGQVKEHLQHDVYTTFYNTHKFEWCLFCDIDEFLMGVRNIKEWLSHFNTAFQIRIKWRLFGDDNKITRDMSKGVVESFKEVKTHSLMRDLKTKGNLENQGKAIVRGGLGNVVVRSPHFASFKTRNNVVPSVLPSGRVCYSKVVINEDYRHETIYLNHYMTKTLSEFINQKMNRTDAVYGDKVKLDYFWRINDKTPEKIKFLKELGYGEV